MQTSEYVSAHHKHKNWRKIVTILAAIVVFVTVYALIMPAATMQGKTYCGYEEHVEHTDECYTETKTLICTISDQAHVHDDSCYEEQRVLVCEEQEGPEHQHNEDCYTTTEVCVCGEEEGSHHEHTDACYKVDKELTCTLPIHKHTLQCYSNPNADVETKSDWEKTFKKVDLTGNWSDDVIAVAETQIGYSESDRNYQVQKDGKTMKGYTRYGDWYGDSYGDWCAMFCSFCLHYAGVDADLMPIEANCQNWINILNGENYGLYHTSSSDYIPAVGDLVFFDWDKYVKADDDQAEAEEARDAEHIGFVAELIYDDETDELVKIKTIEGNCGDRVSYMTYEIDDSRIMGYGELPANPEYCTCGAAEGEPHASDCPAYLADKTTNYDAVNVIVDERTDEETGEAYIVLTAEPTDEQIGKYNWQWQKSTDGESWENIEGATDLVLELPDNEETKALICRIVGIKIGSETADVTVPDNSGSDTAADREVNDSRVKAAQAPKYLKNVNRSLAPEDTKGGNSGAGSSAAEPLADIIVSAPVPLAAIPARATITFDATNGIVNGTTGTAGESYYKGAMKITRTATNGLVTLPTTDDVKSSSMEHSYKLAGWYDVVNRKYYGEELLGTEVELQGSNTPYFYADWVDEDYCVGDAYNSIETPYIGNFVTTRLFDYNDLFNIPNARNSNSTTPNRTGWSYSRDTSTDGLIFYADNFDGSWDYLCTFGTGHLGSIPHGGTPAEYQYSDNLTTGLFSKYGEIIVERLFAPESDTLGKTYAGEADYFYQFDPNTGYYFYDSEKNAATFNAADRKIYLYDNLTKVGNSSTSSRNSALNNDGFLPFNVGNNTSITYPTTGGRANYWFGMSSEITFFLPSDSGTGTTNKVNGDDMIFRFSGDDDVWELVDGELILDIGGIHPRKGGYINFATGECSTKYSNGIFGLGSDGKTETKKFDSGFHTLTIYYMERGGNQSNCKIEFNITPTYDLVLSKKYDTEEGPVLKGAEFSVFKDKECTIPADNLYTLTNNGEKDEMSDYVFADIDDGAEDGSIRCTGMVPTTTYYIKETKAPENMSAMGDNWVIELDINKHAQPTVIAYGEGDMEFWTFADAFKFDENNSLRILLDVFNNPYIGGEVDIPIQKIWTDEDVTPHHDPVKFDLYANGDDTGIRITLSEDNGWENMFTNLKKYDENGDEYVYTVKEEVPDGYDASFEDASFEVTKPAKWEPVTSLKAGKIYRFVTAGKALSINSSNKPVPDDIDDSSTAQQWLAVANGSGVVLRNVNKNTRYLYTGYNSINTSTSTSSRQAVYSNSLLKVGSYYVTMSGSSVSASSSGTSLEAYEFVPAVTSTIPGYKFTNTPKEKTIDIEIKKVDESRNTITTSPAKFEIYTDYGSEEQALFASGETADGVLKVEALEIGTPYWIVEVKAPDGYNLMEGAKQFIVDSDGKINLHEAYGDIYVENGETVVLCVKNPSGYELPETGGVGTVIFYALGATLTAGALMYWYVTKSRKEGRAK